MKTFLQHRQAELAQLQTDANAKIESLEKRLLALRAQERELAGAQAMVNEILVHCDSPELNPQLMRPGQPEQTK
ncbi:MAG: hypothetical protein AAFX93_14180 [Verrucomicrobiota bacterium]